MEAGAYAIQARNVKKHYGRTKEGPGLKGLTLNVPAGCIFGLLGPNGAGKTTAVKVLTTLLRMDEGSATVAGYDVSEEGHLVRSRIGLAGQYAAVDEQLTGYQNLELFGRLNRLTKKHAGRRAEELLTQFDLTEAANRAVGKYSGGMRRRLDLAASLIVSPDVLFVDEPTTGLDPLARQEVWRAIRSLKEEGTTVLLTTQYLEEADQLADLISILKDGRVIREGTPEHLKSSFGGDRLEVTLLRQEDAMEAERILRGIGGASVVVDNSANRISVPVSDRTGSLLKAASAFADSGLEPEDMVLRRPTLDEVFIHFTGLNGVSNKEESR
ncbi:daunorubicin resistance protein DrrA family ABC transporter ATP-binding protein [Paenibacillus antibioticophila]|uniref:Daunorubicin resistance protein DrrA family ABC transporter ATP-binding protein n=1 Tax=Paenibacillus antibioticophila TaxID=1274374 RepID=A0A919XQN0_9BACL|nr:ATP-binding cassette domain-containing protein [Paenibacillus antibioticophila]GIO37457.1 daunorubicin resistance protein DrrA family ABC transporter ATP-binding protein [Paenibacillus antibioticophila]